MPFDLLKIFDKIAEKTSNQKISSKMKNNYNKSISKIKYLFPKLTQKHC